MASSRSTGAAGFVCAVVFAVVAVAAAMTAQGCNLFRGFGSFSASETPTPVPTSAPRRQADGNGTERERTGSVDIRSARAAAAAAAPSPSPTGSPVAGRSASDAPVPTALAPIAETAVPSDAGAL